MRLRHELSLRMGGLGAAGVAIYRYAGTDTAIGTIG